MVGGVFPTVHGVTSKELVRNAEKFREDRVDNRAFSGIIRESREGS